MAIDPVTAGLLVGGGQTLFDELKQLISNERAKKEYLASLETEFGPHLRQAPQFPSQVLAQREDPLQKALGGFATGAGYAADLNSAEASRGLASKQSTALDDLLERDARMKRASRLGSMVQAGAPQAAASAQPSALQLALTPQPAYAPAGYSLAAPGSSLRDFIETGKY